jgi:large subunit ribosomal protein L10
MNREQKAAAIAEIAEQIEQAEAVFAVDYRGISVPQAAELRAKLRDADARFRVVKNSLTERAADQANAESLKPLLDGPPALTFVRGDAAAAAKAIADYAKATDLLPFKGGVMGGEVLEPPQIQAICEVLEPPQIQAIAKLPSRDVLYGQLVGVVASPISGVVRTLNALIQGLASQLGQINEKKQSGEIPAGEAPAEEAPAAEAEEALAAEAEAPAEEAPAEEAEAPAEEAPAAEAEAEAEAEPEATTTDDTTEE